jgi:hypothetical protein
MGLSVTGSEGGSAAEGQWRRGDWRFDLLLLVDRALLLGEDLPLQLQALGGLLAEPRLALLLGHFAESLQVPVQVRASFVTRFETFLHPLRIVVQLVQVLRVLVVEGGQPRVLRFRSDRILGLLHGLRPGTNLLVLAQSLVESLGHLLVGFLTRQVVPVRCAQSGALS